MERDCPYCCLVARPCPGLCDPMDWSPPDSSFSIISRSLLKFTSTELVMISNHLILCLPLLLLPSIFPSIRIFLFPRQQCWRGLPSPSPGDLNDPGIDLTSPALAGRLFTTELPGKPILAFPFPKSESDHIYRSNYQH